MESAIAAVRSANDSVGGIITCVCRSVPAGLGEPVFPEMHPWRYGTDRDGRIVSEKPEDKWNHSVKTVGYGLLHHLGQVEIKRKSTTWNRLQRKK